MWLLRKSRPLAHGTSSDVHSVSMEMDEPEDGDDVGAAASCSPPRGRKRRTPPPFTSSDPFEHPELAPAAGPFSFEDVPLPTQRNPNEWIQALHEAAKTEKERSGMVLRAEVREKMIDVVLRANNPFIQLIRTVAGFCDMHEDRLIRNLVDEERVDKIVAKTVEPHIQTVAAESAAQKLWEGLYHKFTLEMTNWEQQVKDPVNPEVASLSWFYEFTKDMARQLNGFWNLNVKSKGGGRPMTAIVAYTTALDLFVHNTNLEDIFHYQRVSVDTHSTISMRKEQAVMYVPLFHVNEKISYLSFFTLANDGSGSLDTSGWPKGEWRVYKLGDVGRDGRDGILNLEYGYILLSKFLFRIYAKSNYRNPREKPRDDIGTINATFTYNTYLQTLNLAEVTTCFTRGVLNQCGSPASEYSQLGERKKHIDTILNDFLVHINRKDEEGPPFVDLVSTFRKYNAELREVIRAPLSRSDSSAQLAFAGAVAPRLAFAGVVPPHPDGRLSREQIRKRWQLAHHFLGDNVNEIEALLGEYCGVMCLGNIVNDEGGGDVELSMMLRHFVQTDTTWTAHLGEAIMLLRNVTRKNHPVLAEMPDWVLLQSILVSDDSVRTLFARLISARMILSKDTAGNRYYLQAHYARIRSQSAALMLNMRRLRLEPTSAVTCATSKWSEIVANPGFKYIPESECDKAYIAWKGKNAALAEEWTKWTHLDKQAKIVALKLDGWEERNPGELPTGDGVLSKSVPRFVLQASQVSVGPFGTVYADG
jgi:hypothetical protein